MKYLKLFKSETFQDERGSFSNIYDNLDEFNSVKIAKSTKALTWRGFHRQLDPYPLIKLVSVLHGNILDVCINTDKNHPDYKKVHYFEMSPGDSLLIPQIYNHGYLCLTDNAQVLYHISGKYHPKVEKGIRWNDPAFNIELPFKPLIVSEKDMSWKDYEES